MGGQPIVGRFLVSDGTYSVVCVAGTAANAMFLTDAAGLRYYRQQGLPFIKANDVYLYPICLCHRWFRGEELDTEKRQLLGIARKIKREGKENYVRPTNK